jgi:hypothetical protein
VEAKKEKEMLTIYFEPDLVNDLDDFIHLTKKQLPVHKKKKLNRSIIIQLVLKEIIDEHMRFEKESVLSKLISTWKDN